MLTAIRELQSVNGDNISELYIAYREEQNHRPFPLNQLQTGTIAGISLVYLLREELQSSLVTKLPSLKEIRELTQLKLFESSKINSIELFGSGILKEGRTDYLHEVTEILLGLCPVEVRAHAGADLKLVEPTLDYAQQLIRENPAYSTRFGINVYGRTNRTPAKGIHEIMNSARSHGLSPAMFRGGLEHILPHTESLALSENSTHDQLEIIKSFYKELAQNNVHIVSFPETTGVLDPQGAYATTMINLLMLQECGVLSEDVNTEIELHFHNDASLSKQNLMTSIDAIDRFRMRTGKKVSIRVTFTAVGGERNGITSARDLSRLGLLHQNTATKLEEWVVRSCGITGDNTDPLLLGTYTAGSHANFEMDNILAQYNRIYGIELTSIDQLISMANSNSVTASLLKQLAIRISQLSYTAYAAKRGIQPRVATTVVGSARMIQYGKILRGEPIPSMEEAQAEITEIKSRLIRRALLEI